MTNTEGMTIIITERTFESACRDVFLFPNQIFLAGKAWPYDTSREGIALEGDKIEIRCKKHNCNKLLMNYYITGKDVELHMEGFELKCSKCRRLLRLKNCKESAVLEQSEDGVFRV